MTVFLLRSRVVKKVTKLFSVFDSDDDTGSDITSNKFDANAKAHLLVFRMPHIH